MTKTPNEPTSTIVPKPLKPRQLFTRCDPADLNFKTTDELRDFTDPLGQDRAVEAVRFGIGVRAEGFNMFALGPEGTGKLELIQGYLEDAAAAQPVPDDWCYVYNFKDSHKPNALRLPSGRAAVFCKDMDNLVTELKAALPAIFEGEEYANRKQVLEDEVKDQQERDFRNLKERGKKQHVAIMRTPVGLALAPILDDEVLGPEEFGHLSEKQQLKIKEAMADLQDDVEEFLQRAPRVEKLRRERVRGLTKEVTDFAAGHLIAEVRKDYEDLPAVCSYLLAVHEDVVEHVAEFVEPEEGESGGLTALLANRRNDDEALFRRYKVNVLVGHDNGKGAPVIYLDHPTQPNLVGRIEHRQQFGALLTDFNLIKSGALHRANGGYLVIDARMMLMLPFSWEDLKRALRTNRIKVEPPGQAYGYFSTVSLEPEPIPLDVKVILVGEASLYYMLSRYDPDFDELFKVAADFDTRMDRTEAVTQDYARTIAAMARKEALRPLKRDAVARVIEHSARLADDGQKLSTHIESIRDLVREANWWAGEQRARLIKREHVQHAINAQRRRADRIPQAMQENIEQGVMLIDTDGMQTGQVNGLAVYQLGQKSFGNPARITCRVRMGKGEVVDIERETQMGGPIHSKGVLILASYLASHFAADAPLSLNASLVFEQNYGGIEGDSASSTELYALLSALAETPIRQNLAVTGSVNQFGQVQAIGGVNEKIEGFFDLCQARGLTGDQGVLIPAANIRHLMVKPEVVEAVKARKFRVYPVETIDQGIELLTGIPAGELDDKQEYPLGSVNRRVAGRLAELTRLAMAFAEQGRKK